MNERFRWVHTGGPFGDATDNYVIEFDKPLKVSEFIEYLRGRGEWGNIIFDGPKWPYECEIHQNGTDIKPCPEEYLDREIDKIFVNGGWGNNGYDIRLMEKTLPARTETVCSFCDRPFALTPDYPRDIHGEPKAAIVIFGNVEKERYCYSSRHDEVAVCGPMCPQCRETIMRFLKRKGLKETGK